MNGSTVVLGDRGQITLPQAIRMSLGVNPGEYLGVSLAGRVITVRPVNDAVAEELGYDVPPQISKSKYLEFLKTFKGGLWTKADDKARQETRKKEKFWKW